MVPYTGLVCISGEVWCAFGVLCLYYDLIEVGCGGYWGLFDGHCGECVIVIGVACSLQFVKANMGVFLCGGGYVVLYGYNGVVLSLIHI